MLIKISDIKVKKRIRKDMGDLAALKESMHTYGLLNPITLNANHELIAGGRRLAAAKELGWETINATVLTNIDEIKELEMELEENNQRKEFSQDEILDGYERLRKLQNPSIFAKIWHFIKQVAIKIAKQLKKLFNKKGKAKK